MKVSRQMSEWRASVLARVRHLLRCLGQDVLQFGLVRRKPVNALLQLLNRHLVAAVHLVERGADHGQARHAGVTALGQQLAGQRVSAALQLAQQLRRDGDVVAPSQLPDLPRVAEGRGHDDRLVVVRLVVRVDAPDRQHAGVLCGRVVAAVLGLVPVQDAAHKRGDERGARVSARGRLCKREEQRHVAVDALLLQLAARLDALPGGRNLNVDALWVHPLLAVQLHQAQRLVVRGARVIGQVRVNLGRHAPRHNLEHLSTQVHRQRVSHTSKWALGVMGGVFALGTCMVLQDVMCAVARLHSLEHEGWIGGAVPGLVFLDQLNIACVSNDHAHRLQGL
mmetsp:Transcript_26344/g.67050  ORF Transcript_26344/g.67050 Transcript_26344/m.67050 type:complete len:337 (+) Transcript_26344:509-1519(+)